MYYVIDPDGYAAEWISNDYFIIPHGYSSKEDAEREAERQNRECDDFGPLEQFTVTEEKPSVRKEAGL